MKLWSALVIFSSCVLSSASLGFPHDESISGNSHQVPLAQVDLSDEALHLPPVKITADTYPFWAIAHRVLTVGGVRAALEDGANALEIDMTAWNARRKGWWADHGHIPTSAGDTAWEMFNEIRKQRESGRTVSFVWLDIKNPDNCDFNNPKERNCSIEALQHLAREFLEPVGVGALYGFYGVDRSSRAYNYIRGSLRPFEALNIDGDWQAAASEFDRSPSIPCKQRVFSKGLASPYGNLGGVKCEHETGICPELKKAASSRRFGHVFGWTISNLEIPLVPLFLDRTEIDGLIYGFTATYYYKHKDPKKVQEVIQVLVEASLFRHYAGQNDKPW